MNFILVPLIGLQLTRYCPWHHGTTFGSLHTKYHKRFFSWNQICHCKCERHEPPHSSRSTRHHGLKTHSQTLLPRHPASASSTLPPHQNAFPPQSATAPTRFSLATAILLLFFIFFIIVVIFFFFFFSVWQVSQVRVRGMVYAHAPNLSSRHQERNVVACFRRCRLHFPGNGSTFPPFILNVFLSSAQSINRVKMCVICNLILAFKLSSFFLANINC